MNFLIAPDSFKESLSAAHAAHAITAGLKKACPSITTVELPLADGGEGSSQILLDALGGVRINAMVQDPLGRTVNAHYSLLDDGRVAAIEVAQASGLARLDEAEKNPLKSGSFGTGQLILDALDKNVEELWLCLGGSATVDGGLGMAMALGARGLDAAGNPTTPDGQGLIELRHIDCSQLDPRLKSLRTLALSDVDNVLSGPQGTRVYMAQKGATPDMIEQLDTALERWEEILTSFSGKSILERPGAGAAGGIGAGAVALLDAELLSGVEFIFEKVGFDQALERADMAISGEGRVDAQTAYGKVVAGVARRAKRQDIPVIVLCGEKMQSSSILYERGVTAILPIVPGPSSQSQSLENAEKWLKETAFSLGKLLKALGFPR